MHLYKKILLLLLLTFSLRGVVLANTESLHITTKDNLQSDYITSIYRDPRGGVWIGNAEGVSLFDGERVRPVVLEDKSGNVAKVRVNRVVGDSLNLVMLATDIGLYTFDNKRNSFTLSYSSEKAILSLLREDDYILLGRSDGLVLLDKKHNKETLFLPQERVVNILRHPSGTIYILTTTSLYSIATLHGEVLPHIEELLETQGGIFSDMAIADQSIYISQERKDSHSLQRYDISSSQVKSLPNIENTIIRSLCFNEDKTELYCATDGDGVIVYNTQQQLVERRINTTTQSITSNSIKSVLLDPQGILWLGSYSNGVCFLQPAQSFISQVEGTSGYGARSMAIVSDSRYIIGSRDGLLYWRDGSVEYFKSAEYPVIKSDIILSICHYHEDLYLVGTFGGGVFLFDEKRGEPMPFDIDEELSRLLDYESIYGIEIIDDALYFFTLNGLFRYSSHEGLMQWNQSNSSLPSSLLYAYGYDPSREIFYLGSSEGIAIFDISKQEVRRVLLDGVSNDFRSNTISINSRGEIYMDRGYTELLKIDPNTFKVEIIDFALFEKSRVSGVIEQHDSESLWIATTNGLYNYNTTSGQSICVTQKSGLATTNICPNAMVQYGDHIFLGSEDGLFTFSLQLSPQNITVPQVAISQIKINGKKLAIEPLVAPQRESTNGEQPLYNIEIFRGDKIELELIEPLFRRAFSGRYAISIGDDNWYSSSGNAFELSSLNMSIGSHEIYIKVANDHRHEWSEPIYIGELRVRLKRGVVALIIIVVSLPLLYIFSWRTKRKMQLRKRQKGSRENVIAKRDIDTERSQQVIAVLRTNLESSGDYRNPKYKLKDLSDATGVPSSEISYLLNNYLKISFSDFVNEYRIEDVKKLLLEDDANYYILPILAERCGFNSKSSFYRVFKEKTGLTPMQYRKKHE